MDAELSNRIGKADERFVPGTAPGRLIELEHLVRYWWASALAPGRRVLDAGCGVGYGTEMLGRAGAAEVVGVDVSPEAVRAAEASAGSAATFVVGDVRELPFDAGRFDLVTCFETIEHVERQDDAITELARVLGSRGVLAMSSPNRDVYPPGNPHHAHEYRPEELRAALATVFDHVELRRQHGWLASAVLDDEQAADDGLGERPDVAVGKAHGAPSGSELFTIALASRESLPTLPGRVLVGGLAQIGEWLRQEAEFVGMQGERERAVADFQALRGIEEQLRAETATLLRELDQERATLQRVYGSASWRLTRPLRKAAARLRRR